MPHRHLALMLDSHMRCVEAGRMRYAGAGRMRFDDYRKAVMSVSRHSSDTHSVERGTRSVGQGIIVESIVRYRIHYLKSYKQ
jgi:hypothetical protein